MADRGFAICSITRSVWDRVTPDLRGVAFTLTDDSLIVRFSYADVPSERTKALVSDAEAECIGDYHPPFRVGFVIEHVPITRRRTLGSDEGWVYLRHEAPADEPTASLDVTA